MKIAVTSTGTGLDSGTDPRFGRASGFIIFDTDSSDFIHMENTVNMDSIQGAGIQSAKNIIDSGAKILITGNIGPKAFTVLKGAGIDVYLTPVASIKEVIDSFIMGDLEVTSDANVSGHWGGRL